MLSDYYKPYKNRYILFMLFNNLEYSLTYGAIYERYYNNAHDIFSFEMIL